jgi:hypothetical protein
MTEIRQTDLPLDELTRPQPDSEDPTHLAYVAENIRAGQGDVKSGRVISEDKLWKDLGIDN